MIPAVAASTIRGAKAMPWAAAIGAFLIIFAAKLLLIRYYGSPVPHMDEWDGDASNLLVPFLDGQLTWNDLLSAHNEHRILLTRLLVLAVVEISGRWDLIAQMEINAAIHAASLVMIALMLADAASNGRNTAIALTVLAFTIVASVIPFGLGNTLQAFQTQFYLFIALSFGCIALLVPAAAFSARWWAGVVVGAASLFSIASGALLLCAPLAVACFQMLRGQRRGARELAGMLFLAGVVALLMFAVPTVPRHIIYRAHSIAEFSKALGHVSAWPVGLSMFVITQGTSLVASLVVITIASARTDLRWRLVASFIWVGIQMVVLSWSRALAPTESRYLDLFIIGQIVGAGAAMMLVYEKRPKWLGPGLIRLGVAGWFFVILGSYAQTALSFLPRNLKSTQPGVLGPADHLREYFAHAPSHNAADEDWMSRLFPDTDLLRQVLDNPAIRAILPQSSGGNAPENWLSAADDILLRVGPLLLAIGLVLFAAAVIASLRGARGGTKIYAGSNEAIPAPFPVSRSGRAETPTPSSAP